MTRRRNIGDVQVNRLLLRSASVTKDSALAASCDEPLAAGRVGRTPRGGSTQRATPRGLDSQAIVCRICQDRTRIGPSVRWRPPRFSNITETEAWHDFRCRTEERKLLCPNHCVHCGFHTGWGFAVGPRSTGKLRFAFSSVA